jgi:hypothetical protein
MGHIYWQSIAIGDFREIIMVLGSANRLKANAKRHLNLPDYFSALAIIATKFPFLQLGNMS